MHDPTTAALGGYMMLFIALGIPCGLFSAWLASQKGHNEALWFFGGLIFSVLALIAIAGAPDRRDEKRRKDPEREKLESNIRAMTRVPPIAKGLPPGMRREM